jgi:hypothetical protein
MKCFAMCAFLMMGCGAIAQQGDTLMESVRTYDEGLRWGRYSAAATRVPPREREAFLDERDELAKDLHITDYDLIKVGAKHDDRATVEVKYSWFKETEGTLRETRAVQQWERHGASWMLVEERRSHGPEMPGLAEPATPPADDAEATHEGAPGGTTAVGAMPTTTPGFADDSAAAAPQP